MNRVKWAKPSSYIFIIAFLFLLPLIIDGPYELHILIMTCINVILVSSFRLLFTSGMISLAHGGMMSIGAYTSALLVIKLNASSWVALIIAGVGAGIVALLVAYPFVRVRGVYFVMLTVFFGEIIRLISEQWRSLTGGTSGLINVPRPDSFFIPGLMAIDFSSKIHYYYLIIIIVLVCLLILYALENSRIGRTLFSIRQSDSLAESVGIDTTGFKVAIFCISCFFAGISGGFYSQYMGVIGPGTFGFLYTFNIVVYSVVGGGKRFVGPIIGTVFLMLYSETFRGLNEYQPFVFAGILMLIIFFLPDGLVSLPQRVKKFISIRKSHA